MLKVPFKILPLLAILTHLAGVAAADECDAVAAGISGATLLHVKKRASYGSFIDFDVGRSALMLSCRLGTSLSFTFFGSSDIRFPPPSDLLVFSRAVAAMSAFKDDSIYSLSVKCEQAALRDTREGPPGGPNYGEAKVPVSDRAHYLVCTADHESFTFTIEYHDVPPSALD